MTGPSYPALSVIIPTLNAADELAPCLEAVKQWPGPREVIIVDGGSGDDTVAIAHGAGATVLPTEAGRGIQLRRGGAAAKHDWLLFLHADSILQTGWADDVSAFMMDMGNRQRAAAFGFALDDASPQARRVERMVAWRCRNLGLPYGDQGLLIHRDLYDAVGGFRPLVLMEDVDIIRRLGRNNVHVFESAAKTSAIRYRTGGWWLRPSLNVFCLFLYICGVPPRWIAKFYG